MQNVTDALSDQDVFDLIFGSGFTLYSWWRDVYVNWSDRTAQVAIDDPGAPEPAAWEVGGRDHDPSRYEISRVLTVADLRRAIHEVAMNDEIKSIRLASNWIDPDFDADDADCIVQYALLGDVVYG